MSDAEHVELKPYRQTWLSKELMHSAPSAYLCIIDGEQWAQLEHPKGGPLTCVKNRTGKTASAVVQINGKWHFQFDAPGHQVKEEKA